MKAIFHIIAILAAGGAAYFSYDHSVKFKEQQKLRIDANDQNRAVTASAEATEKELKDEQGALKLAQDQREELTQSISALKSNENQLKRELGEIEGLLEEQKAEFDQLKKTEEEVNRVVESIKEDLNIDGEVNIDTLAGIIGQIEEDKKAREKKLEELETLVAAAEKKLAQNNSDADRLTQRKLERNNRISRNAMEAVITAVEQGWGFVVIGAGSNTGFTPQTSLLVKRDGKLIGRVRPSSIEPNQTIAEIDQESLVLGVRLQPGDRVILARPATN
jgi:chromosome segregation ATPase